MVNAVVAEARARARAAYEEYHYDGICTVSVLQRTKNPVTRISEAQEHTVYEGEPCHLSLGREAAQQSEAASSLAQPVTLFISPELVIMPGSKITVSQAGVTTAYTHSGKAAVYDTHQEIALELFERWA